MEIGTQKIETQRLILRRFKLSDAKAMFNNYTSDTKVTEFLNWQPHKSAKETKKVLLKWTSNYHNKQNYNWAIELKEIGQVIGSISANRNNVLWHNGKKAIITKEIGYALGSDWWGKGIMTEALSAVIDFLFANTDTTRIAAKHNPENIGSGKVMQNAGMQYEGTFRQCHTSNYGVEDSAVYAILRSDYISKT